MSTASTLNNTELLTTVVPLLRLARTAALLDDMLRDVDDSRAMSPELDAALKKRNLSTSLGASIADDLVLAIGLAIDLIHKADESEEVRPARVPSA